MKLGVNLKKSFAIPILLVLVILSACNMPSESVNNSPKDFTFGTWNCSYLENGFYAAVPLVMDQNGTVEFQNKQGTWGFESQTNIFTFSSDIPIQNAMYSSGTQTLDLTLTAGQTVGGNANLSCTAPQ